MSSSETPGPFLPAVLLALYAGAVATQAGPTTSSWPVSGPGEKAAVACASLAGWYAVANSSDDSIEIRDINRTLLRTITRSEILARCSWMSLDSSADGPCALAFSDSGRLLFIAVSDASPALDGQPSDGILRYDTQTGAISGFARVEISSSDSPAPHAALAHFKGRLYAGINGGVQVYRAQMNDTTGVSLSFTAGAVGAVVNGLAVDRAQNHLYAAWNNQISRATTGGASLTFTSVGSLPVVRALAYSDHYGGAANPGLYALESTASPASAKVWFVPPLQARGLQTFAPTTYLTSAAEWHDLAASADGALLAGAGQGLTQVNDTTDTRLSFNAWTADEFAHVVAFGKSLISPDGEPAGWVIDADVQVGWSRFHPATPDAACWAVMLLLMSDRINGDPQAQGLVRTILERHAGRSGDGIAPIRSADGIYHHWIDSYTGGVKPGWDPEYATMSTMLIGSAAARAAAYYPDDSQIQLSARAILCGIGNWGAYFQAGSDAMYLKALAGGGPDPGSPAGAFHEGMMFAEQAAWYGPASAQTAYSHWLDRTRWPVATLVSGRSITGNVAGGHQPAFVSLFELLTIADFRASPEWQTQILNLRLSNAAWTDDNGPKYNTVFSAGTTRTDWGGYNADSLSGHPGDVTTFPSLMAMAAGTGAGAGDTAPAVGAYNAYRRGARQTFAGGASILYRRSNVDLPYAPNSAALVDTALGGLGLAELLQPGSVAAVLTGPYPSCFCPADYNQDGFVDGIDYDLFNNDFESPDPVQQMNADLNGDGFVDGIDYDQFNNHFEGGC